MQQKKDQTLSIGCNVSKAKSYKQCLEFKLTQPDLYIILSDKIYPLHRRFMSYSTYIAKKMSTNENVVIVEFEINVIFAITQFADFQKILNFLYTNEFQFIRSQEIQKYIKLAKILQIDALQQQIYEDFSNNFEEYSIFVLYNIAYKYDIKELMQKCDKYFLQLEYQQINIYTYDLLQVSQTAFQQIIRKHQKLKANKTISGLGNNQIRRIIQEYCSKNKCQININQLLLGEHDCFTNSENTSSFNSGELSKSNENKKAKTLTTKVSKSCVPFQNKFKQPYKSQPVTLAKGKNVQIEQLKIINETMQKNNQKRIEQLRQIRDAIIDIDNIESPLVDILDIQERIKQFQRICEEQNQIVMEIHKQLSFNEISQKAQQQQQQQQQKQSQTQSCKLQNSQSQSKKGNVQQNRSCKNQLPHKKNTSSSQRQDQLFTYSQKMPQLNKNFLI